VSTPTRSTAPANPPTEWGKRAAAIYSEPYAQRYREHDEQVRGGGAVTHLASWLRTVSERFPAPPDVLDLGCGTGRYFHVLTCARRLVGIDVSGPMLERAQYPVGEPGCAAGRLTLIEGDFLTHEFEPCEFDLVYSIGVVGEHSPFDETLASRVRRWLRPGGRLAFTTVHPLSASVPRTLGRRIGEWVLPIARGTSRRALRSRLMRAGLYADEERVQDVLAAAGFSVESMELFQSDVHLHVLTVAEVSSRV
jgi:SAM-dependent methyltransferase